MCCAPRGVSGIWRDDHRQFAKQSIPTPEPIRAIRSLQDFLQDRRRKPDGFTSVESFGEPFDHNQIVTA